MVRSSTFGEYLQPRAILIQVESPWPYHHNSPGQSDPHLHKVLTLRPLLASVILTVLLPCAGPLGNAFALPPLQLYIELTPEGETVELPPGRYAGPAVIDRRIKLDGRGEVEVDGGKDGTVITLRADHAEVRGLHIINSGISHNTVDAGISIEANHTRVEDNRIENVLFGIHLKNASNNVVKNNRVTSLDRDISIRGDGIRMWYSHENLIENNHLSDVRDIAANNSLDNRLIGNTIENSRIGMEFIYSHGTEVAHNTVINNYTGIVLIYSNELDIHDNRIAHMRKLTGSGISFKESAQVDIYDNEIAHCNIGLLANTPLDPENRMTARGNLIAYNVLGIYFYGEKGGHLLHKNYFANNFTDAVGSRPPASRHNEWNANYWDRYQGFDLDADGTGDRPHEAYLFTEHIWNDYPMGRFFRGTPMMALLDFAYRLAPLKPPELEYSDPAPVVLK